MSILGPLAAAAHTAAALAVVLGIAAAGRNAARRLRQPEVIGEITVGLLAGPVVLGLFGRGAFDLLLPGPVLHLLTLVAQTGLVLYLVGLAHELRAGPNRPARRATAWVAVGSLVPPLLTGAALAGWVVLTGDEAVRGGAPLPAFLLMTAVAMSITAVPVMARIMTDRGMSGEAAGRLALTAAIVVDALGWLLLTAAVSLGAGSLAGTLRAVQALLAGAVCALAVRYALRTRAAGALCGRWPRWTALLLGGTALAVASAMEHLGMTAILGAALTGVAVPGDAQGPWGRAVDAVSGIGRFLTPVFFVVTGITVLSGALATVSWSLIFWTLALGCVGKFAGGYLGARVGGQPRTTSLRVGVLLNTRGLTELIVLQVGYQAGLLAAPLVLALVVMALVTTAMTGPLLNLLDRRARARQGSPDAGAAGAKALHLPTESGAP